MLVWINQRLSHFVMRKEHSNNSLRALTISLAVLTVTGLGAFERCTLAGGEESLIRHEKRDPDLTRIKIVDWRVLPDLAFSDLTLYDVSRDEKDILAISGQQTKELLLIPLDSYNRKPKRIAEFQGRVIQAFFASTEEVHVELANRILRINIANLETDSQEYRGVQITEKVCAFGLYPQKSENFTGLASDQKVRQIGNMYGTLVFRCSNHSDFAIIEGPSAGVHITDFHRNETRTVDMKLPLSGRELDKDYRIQIPKVGQGFIYLLKSDIGAIAESKETGEQGHIILMILQLCDADGNIVNLWKGFKDDSGVLEEGKSNTGFLHPPIVLSTHRAIGVYEWANRQKIVLINLAYADAPTQAKHFEGNWMLIQHRRTGRSGSVNSGSTALSFLAEHNELWRSWIPALWDDCVTYYQDEKVRKKVDEKGLDRLEISRDDIVIANYRIGDGVNAGREFMRIIYDYYQHRYPDTYKDILDLRK